ncbi:UNVERIFIED_CONTAM: hypothetical protein Sradi_3586300 [Sesamum radiatum]|uniref:DDE Tnp4 domain-containing protein n=1 Tax=Sesamum radiatum TaxID=300843 RepID=A0AAW2QHN6_SESRA
MTSFGAAEQLANTFILCLGLFFGCNHCYCHTQPQLVMIVKILVGDGLSWALDGTHIEVRVSDSDKGRYRNRKGQTSLNVLGVCNTEGLFTYVMTGWEGSSADGRVLRSAVSRPTGLKVPTGNYYLCDNGYANGEGFLTPFRGVRYHLKEWDRGAGGPQTAHELFNLRHAAARNIIERAFGLLKTRWGYYAALRITQSMCRTVL